ncbi:NlpC/P60 family protein [Luteipulveratus sp. YIM 133132]|uniref:NlpC/P60 family protein n=1 Tax=Luteipulveratus flavus TaxID=3031728 RepID=A0ABT6C429_9MICO|nr:MULTISPECIES: C40 family peptidase [unclassified Luteipulveratus]MDE9364206.1 NlpC/P60 family protein [Luteipulveratus sp. YIM 133132]MDF8263632.1 NlpC/P60 family protein [Luteipulveratus sp. YIM 133296]
MAAVAAPADAQGLPSLTTPPTEATHVAAAPTAVSLPAIGSSAGVVSVGQIRLPDVVEARDLVKKPATRTAPVVKRVSRSVATKVTRHTTSTPAPSTSDDSSDSGSATAERVLEIAKRYIGVDYVYGGTTPDGFDCSGFTSYVFRQVGIDLNRTARTQQTQGYRVSEPRPGDLVFTDYPATHVAIYVGDGMVIDSPKPGGEVNIHKNWSGNNFRRVL